MARKWLLLAGLVVGVAVVALVASRRNAAKQPRVDVARPTRRDVFRSWVTASGQIVASRYADIGASAMGRIVALAVAEGDAVRAGQVLARIDPVQARSSLEAAEAELGALEADEAAAREQLRAAQAERAAAGARAREASLSLERTLGLHAQGLVAPADLDQAQAADAVAGAQAEAAAGAVARAERAAASAGRRAAQARARRLSAQDLLAKTDIASPIDGMVSRLLVREGEMVVVGIQNQPGTTLMTVSDLSAIDAEVKVAEADVLRVEVGATARVSLEALAEHRFAGRVVEVGASALAVPDAGAAAREFRVVVRLDSPDPGLKPGLSCDAEILASERHDVLTLPLQALVMRDTGGGEERTGVFVLRDGQARFRPARAGIIGGLDVEVEGIEPTSPVIVGPVQALRGLQDGAAVRTR